jgi:hypothetical protein
MAAAPNTPLKIRYGCFPAKIGCDFQHKLERILELPSGRKLPAGTVIYLTVQDITRYPEAEGHIKWRCSHPGCAGKHWPTKKDLLAAHPSNRELERAEETHLFMAVAYTANIPGSPEKRAKDGSLEELARPAKPATVLLLTDEE